MLEKSKEGPERILIVGLGSIGTRHVRIARALLPKAQIGVLRHQSCDGLPANIGINCCFTELDAALRFEPQAAVIANPATHHLDVAMPLAHAGVHLLIEKPIAATTQGLAALIGTCRVKGLTLMTGYNLRFLPSLQKFRERLLSGYIGQLLSVRAEVGQYLPAWRPDADYRAGVSAHRDLGGGALLELSHEIDYLRWIFGEVAWLQAVIRRQSTLEIDVEDTVHLTMGFVAATRGRQLIANLNMDFIRHDTTRVCTVIGEEGSLRWNGLTGAVELYEPGKNWKEIYRHQHQRDDSYRSEWLEFLDSIENQKPPTITGQDGLRTLQLIEAARFSNANQSAIKHLEKI